MLEPTTMKVHIIVSLVLCVLQGCRADADLTVVSGAERVPCNALSMHPEPKFGSEPGPEIGRRNPTASGNFGPVDGLPIAVAPLPLDDTGLPSGEDSEVPSKELDSRSSPDFGRGVALRLPQFTITTADNQPIDRELYLTAAVSLTDDGTFASYAGTTEIRGRGHSTWGAPKKPYRIKLTDKVSLLGMPASRHWVLLASYSDKTLLRDDVVFNLGEAMGFAYTPRHAYVEVHLNGQYNGIYQLTEHIRVASNRVDIQEADIADTSPDLITGGYLIEVDSRRGEDLCIDATHTQMVFCLVSPETLLDPKWAAHRQYIESYLQQTEDAIFSADFADPEIGYAGFIDVDSAVAYYLVNELTKNVDGNLHLSTFLHKRRDGKLTFGPLWDFDRAIGNVNYAGADQPEGWHMRSAPWFARMFEDPAFEQRVRQRWAQLKSAGMLGDMFGRIDARAYWLSDVQRANFERWDILDTQFSSSRVVTGSYQGEVDAMKDWLQERIEWMDARLSH
jgi:hypothetical protein